MAEPRGALAFSQNGYYLERKDGYSWQQIPEELEKEIALTKKHTIRCIAFGENNNYFCTWKAKHHLWKTEKILFSLESYPKLRDYLSDITKAKDIDLTTFHVNLGPIGSFYVNSNRGQYYHGLDTKVENELRKRLSSDGVYNKDPLYVALGVDESYVLLGSKGDIMWDLKGKYGDLDDRLKTAKFGVRSIALSPHDSDQYYVIYKDGSSHSSTKHGDWSFAVD